MTEPALPRATFHQMKDGTRGDWQRIAAWQVPFRRTLPERILSHLRLLGGDFGGFAVDRLTHSLQTAALAQRDGRDEEYVVCALLHDIGDSLSPWNHGDLAAAILRPFVSEQNHWMVQKHPIFQGVYYFHHVGADPELRERFRGHPAYEATAEFCELYDQAAFDPGRDTPPLEHFEPLLRRVLSEPRQLGRLVGEVA